MYEPRPRFVARELGPATIGALVVAQAVLWTVARPGGESTASYLGQVLGAESILLLSIGLVLISTLPWVEEWFDGIDRAAIWHRRVAIAGLLLLAPHVAAGVEPGRHRARRPARRRSARSASWRSRCGRSCRAGSRSCRRRCAASSSPLATRPSCATCAASSAATSAGARCTAPPGCSSPPASCTACSTGRRSAARPSCAGATSRSAPSGSAFYVYRELLARFFLSLHDYQVDAVRQIGEGLVEIALRPLGRPVRFVPGQFAMVYLEAKDGWHRHPFTISSAPHEDVAPRHGQGARRLHVAAAGAHRARHARGHRRPARALRPRARDRAAGLDRRRRRRRAVPQLAARARRASAARRRFLLHHRRRGAVRRRDPR